MRLFPRKRAKHVASLDEAQDRLEIVEEHIRENARVLETCMINDPWARSILKSLRD